MQKQNNTSGFTIVELLIVIVVIGILAAITIVSFNGVQARSKDTRRLQDMAAIRKSLEIYKVQNGGTYPVANPNPGSGGWEVSTDSTWLNSLSSVSSKMPADPVNDSTHYYAYFRYAAGSFGCPAEKGPFYLLRVQGLQATDGTEVSDLGDCPGITGSIRTPSSTQAVFIRFQD